MMTLRSFLAIVCVCISTACAVGAIHLYPVETSSVGQPQTPILSGTIIYAGPSATISFRLPDGEKLHGPCTFGSAAGINDDLRGPWDSATLAARDPLRVVPPRPPTAYGDHQAKARDALES
jgi:hypothetical protein